MVLQAKFPSPLYLFSLFSLPFFSIHLREGLSAFSLSLLLCYSCMSSIAKPFLMLTTHFLILLLQSKSAIADTSQLTCSCVALSSGVLEVWRRWIDLGLGFPEFVGYKTILIDILRCSTWLHASVFSFFSSIWSHFLRNEFYFCLEYLQNGYWFYIFSYCKI